MSKYKGRPRTNNYQVYSRPAMYPADFNTLDALARGAGISKPEMLGILVDAAVKPGENAYVAGQRIGRERYEQEKASS